jgi:hypothetical protein
MSDDSSWMTTVELEDAFRRAGVKDENLQRVRVTLRGEHRNLIGFVHGSATYNGQPYWRFIGGHTAESVLALLMLEKDEVVTMPAQQIEQAWLPGEDDPVWMQR